jgi:hypothetical protein
MAQVTIGGLWVAPTGLNLIGVAGNPYRKGRISTLGLLVLTISDLPLLILSDTCRQGWSLPTRSPL